MSLSTRTKRDLRLLGIAFLAAGIARWVAALHFVPVPTIHPDELTYQRLAFSIAHAEAWDPRLMLFKFPFIGYPALISPLYAVLPPERAYDAARLLNALAIGAGCFPQYLLARRLLPRRWSLGCAALSLLVPALGYGSNVLSECLFYPLSSLVLCLAVPWIAGPARRTPLGLGAAGSVLMLTKVQGAFTLAFLGAIALALPWLTLRQRLQRAWKLSLAGGLAAGGYALVGVIRLGRHFAPGQLATWLGLYEDFSATQIRPDPMVALRTAGGTLFATCAELAPAAGMFALFAAAALAMDRRVRKRARVLCAAVFGLVLVHTLLATRQATGFDANLHLFSRYVAYLAPSLLVAAALAWRAWTRRTFALAALGTTAAGVAVALWIQPYLGLWQIVSDCPSLAWMKLASEPAAHAYGATLGACGLGALAASFAVLRRPAWAGALVGALGACASAGFLLAQNRVMQFERTFYHDAVSRLGSRLPPGRRYYVLDGVSPTSYWLDSFFHGVEDWPICFHQAGACRLEPPGEDGRLPASIEPGALMIVPDTVALSAPPIDREENAATYLDRAENVGAYRAERGLRVLAVRKDRGHLWVAPGVREVSLVARRPGSAEPVRLRLKGAAETEISVEPNRPVTVPLPPPNPSGEVALTSTPEVPVSLTSGPARPEPLSHEPPP